MQLLIVIALLCQGQYVVPKEALACHKYYLSCVSIVSNANPKASLDQVVGTCVMHREIK